MNLRFWAAFAWETATTRRLSRLVRPALRGARIAETAGDLPGAPFVLAVNHFEAGRTLDTIATVLSALERPDDVLLVVGHRERPDAGWATRAIRSGIRRLLGRWSDNILRVRTDRADVASLRRWRTRARRQVVLVFPEGRASRELMDVRPGAGRWLGALGVPTVPVAVHCSASGWHVAFGPPLRWSARPELRDLQLGLAMAALLPAELAPDWQELLDRFRAVHAG